MATNIYAFQAQCGKRLIDFQQEFKGKVLLIVNVATKCGYSASNYPQLQDLSDKYHDQGLRILLFPCNQFMGQEPGTNEQISEYACHFSPRFYTFDKVDVNGSNQSPIYAFLKQKCGGFLFNAIKWNFTKFLVDAEGNPVRRYGPGDEPKTIEPEIQRLLAASSK